MFWSFSVNKKLLLSFAVGCVFLSGHLGAMLPLTRRAARAVKPSLVAGFASFAQTSLKRHPWAVTARRGAVATTSGFTSSFKSAIPVTDAFLVNFFNVLKTEFGLPGEWTYHAESGVIKSQDRPIQIAVLRLGDLKSLVAPNDVAGLYRIFVGKEDDVEAVRNELVEVNAAIARDFFVYEKADGSLALSHGKGVVSGAFPATAVMLHCIASTIRQSVLSAGSAFKTK